MHYFLKSRFFSKKIYGIAFYDDFWYKRHQLPNVIITGCKETVFSCIPKTTSRIEIMIGPANTWQTYKHHVDMWTVAPSKADDLFLHN